MALSNIDSKGQKAVKCSHEASSIRQLAVQDTMKRKFLYALMAVGVIAYSVYCIKDFAGMARRSHTRDLERELVAIAQATAKMEPGLPRAEELLRRTKAVDPGLAPVEVKQALRDYITALEGALNAMKSGRDAKQYDLPMEQAHKRLGELFEKYR